LFILSKASSRSPREPRQASHRTTLVCHAGPTGATSNPVWPRRWQHELGRCRKPPRGGMSVAQGKDTVEPRRGGTRHVPPRTDRHPATPVPTLWHPYRVRTLRVWKSPRARSLGGLGPSPWATHLPPRWGFGVTPVSRPSHRTSRLTDAGPMMSDCQPRRDPGVRCSRFVRRLAQSL
jgi:hypothetical protein